ncbi:MAG: hypothetical protein M5U23_04330 [Acidimicrobiia bacterium]|nr:hypothetical protein [Acidimicrobiia bacterium]
MARAACWRLVFFPALGRLTGRWAADLLDVASPELVPVFTYPAIKGRS